MCPYALLISFQVYDIETLCLLNSKDRSFQGDVKIYKPFVEKPSNGDDHNVWVYYPRNMGGGVKKMFRKIGNKSAEHDPDHAATVRRDGSYIYEKFVAACDSNTGTGIGTDIKVYTVGEDYAHAEARKSPVVDGEVLRDADGKEVMLYTTSCYHEKSSIVGPCASTGSKLERLHVCPQRPCVCRSDSLWC